MTRDLKAAADRQELVLIVKVSKQGAVKAVADAIGEFNTDHVETRLVLVQTGVGDISESDITLAVASRAMVLGFNVRPNGEAGEVADREGVNIHLYNILYDAITCDDDLVQAMKDAFSKLLPPKNPVRRLGLAEVRQVFRIPKSGTVAACIVSEGVIQRSAEMNFLIRDSVTIWSGRLSGIRHFKDDVREVTAGQECGISLDNCDDIKAGDVIECCFIER